MSVFDSPHYCFDAASMWLALILSLLSDSNQRPRDYKSRALANWAKEAISEDPIFRAEDGAQTRDPQLGRLVLYQLSYFRSHSISPLLNALAHPCGQGRIRTAEAVRQQIYSLPVLTTYLPTLWRTIALRIKSDSHRIQTCNLLIRSQMLYSVELASLMSYLYVGVDGFEPPTLCL